MALDYDKMIEVKKQELAKIEASIPVLLEERDKQIKEGNQTIFDNKEKAEKIIADATARGEDIVSIASDIKAEAEKTASEASKRNAEVGEKEKAHVEISRVTKEASEKLAQDKIDFGKQQKAETAKVETALASTRELLDVVASLGKTINAKIAEIAKI